MVLEEVFEGRGSALAGMRALRFQAELHFGGSSKEIFEERVTRKLQDGDDGLGVAPVPTRAIEPWKGPGEQKRDGGHSRGLPKSRERDKPEGRRCTCPRSTISCQ